MLAALCVIDVAIGSVSRRDPGWTLTVVRDRRGTKANREHGEACARS